MASNERARERGPTQPRLSLATEPDPLRPQPRLDGSPGDRDGDLAIAVDGTFVETTSEAAAKSMARFYSAQEGEGGIRVEYAIQQRVDKAGRTLYRIRPLSERPVGPSARTAPLSSSTSSDSSVSPSSGRSLPFARPSHQPSASPASASERAPSPTIALHRSSPNRSPRSLHQSRSIPVLRSESPAQVVESRQPVLPSTPDKPTRFLHPHTVPASPDRSLRRIGSTPALAHSGSASLRTVRSGQLSAPVLSKSASLSHATSQSSHASTEGDVLGRILGWREEANVARGGESGSGRAKRRANASARVPLPEMFRSTIGRKASDASSTSKPKGKTAKGTHASSNSHGSDVSDLPDDLVEELASSHLRDENDVLRPPMLRAASYTSPFGSGVRIPRTSGPPATVPQLQVHSAPPTAAPERTMREVASNDSIRTARADDPIPASTTPRMRHGFEPQEPPRRPPRFEDPEVFDLFHQAQKNPASPPAVETASPFGQHARFPSSSSIASTASDRSRTTAQGITVLPAPGDDPRFVIWGSKETPAGLPTAPTPAGGIVGARRPSLAHSTSPPLSGDLRRTSHPDGDFHPSPATSASGSPATTSSRRWSLSARRGRRDSDSGFGSPATSVRDSVGSTSAASSASGPAQRILMAATVERLVAELTSQISVELLSNFFLTYRHYLSPLDLLHLLLTRFDWAMSPCSSSEDEALRRVVRVRTFVVIRYWLLNHFMDDFYPSREMRTGLTEWLNSSARDPRFRESQRDARLIKNLKKTVRKCKETFVAGRPAATSGGMMVGRSDTASADSGRRPSEDDVDLDLLETSAFRTSKSPPPSSTSFKFATRRGRKPSSMSSGSMATEPAFPLPGTPQNPIARSFASAVGTFGRFKRMLGQRASNAGMGDEGGRDVEFEESETGDLLWVRGGLEKYLEYWDIRRQSDASEDTPDIPAEDTPDIPEMIVSESTPDPDVDTIKTPRLGDGPDATTLPVERARPIDVVGPDSEKIGLGLFDTPAAAQEAQKQPPVADYSFPPRKRVTPAPLLPIFDPETYSAPTDLSPSAAAFGQRPLSARIELDDLDDSDDDDDVIEAKRTLKRLPNAHNLQLAALGASQTPASLRRSFESELSYGFGSGSRLSYGGPERESVLYVDDEEGLAPGEVGVTIIPNFILEGLFDSEDEDEPGDVEAALRRLEGLVDDSREQKKAKKVERQMERSEQLELERKRREAGIASPTDSIVSSRRPSLASQAEQPEDSEEPPTTTGAEPQPHAPSLREAAAVDIAASATSEARRSIDVDAPFSTLSSAPVLSVPTPPSSLSPVASLSPPRPSRSTSRLGMHAVYPSAAGRKATLSRIFGHGATSARPASARPGLAIPHGPPPPTHRSFLLFCRTETLAQQFTLIERDMLRMLSYQELVSGSWKNRMGETDVLDWELYLKERRKEDLVAKGQGHQVMSAVRDVISRFNLMANWVSSEILLTASIDERAILIGKFIRLAFKCYCLSNFQTVMQIVHGLQIPHIERLRKTWSKVPSWEIRKLEGMQRFISHLKNFAHLRDLMNRIADEYAPSNERSSISDPIAGLAAKGCIPFTGLFLRDLALNAELPTFLDPTSTNAPVSVDAAGSLVSIADPTAFDDFPPLPAGLALQPLVNVHKFRKLATIVQRIRTFQALADHYAFEPIPSIYFKCLKIRSLDQGVMAELSHRLES
ncbi:hypothetical protein JCM10212_004917 [Sporobolomyces blumeae]